MKRHEAEEFLAMAIHKQAERKEPTDQRPVGVDTTSLRLKENTVSVFLSTKDGLFLFNALEEEFLYGQVETTGETPYLVR